MLSKKHRFHGRGSLNYTYKHGEIVRSPHCAIKFVKGKTNTYRVAVVVSKKVDGSAVKRNRIRRRVFEAIRLQADDILTNQDIVVNVFDGKFLEMTHKEILSSIKRQLKDIARLSC